jgi:voltage-gated sodium channel
MSPSDSSAVSVALAAGAGFPSPEGRLPARLRQIARAPWFVRTIIVVILLTGATVGLETYPIAQAGGPLATATAWVQTIGISIFVVELAIRIGAYGRHPWRFFRKGWNVFDFAVVGLSILPFEGEYFIVLRLLRTLRLFSAVPGLQVLVSALVRGIPALGFVGLLLLLHFYIYAVIGTFLFGDNDPLRFGSLHNTMLTLFQVLTLEGWNDIMATEYFGSDIGYDDSWKDVAGATFRHSRGLPLFAAGYFVSFILIGTMIVLNLVTGVIIRSIEEAHEAAAEEGRRRRMSGRDPADHAEDAKRLSEQLQDIAKHLSALEQHLGHPLPRAAETAAARPTGGAAHA